MIRVFVLGGLLCVAFQLLRSFLKSVPPPKMNVLGFILGGIITPFGLSDALNSWGDWGYGVTVIAGGNAGAKAFLELIQGKFAPLLASLCLFLAIYLIGLLSGIIRQIIEKKKSSSI
ncbi:MAG: hypothetical protein II845_02910 [Oscillospiraceae bacterium]|nr:hypothetical protein [Oscillospiraceae bacterium]